MKKRKKPLPNGHRAIMGDRVHPNGARDNFPTPPWSTRALFEHVFPSPLQNLGNYRVWEPACGAGHMAEVLGEYFGEVFATDKYSYHSNGREAPYWLDQVDFLKSKPGDIIPDDVDWTITNPPFGKLSELFILKALEISRVGVAMFLRSQWLETVGRYERIFKPHPPAIIAQFAERVPLCKGRWNPDGSTATSYCWVVWLKRHSGPTQFMWIPPGQRTALTRPDDRVRFTARPVLPASPSASAAA
jgi:hypothetical protein